MAKQRRGEKTDWKSVLTPEGSLFLEEIDDSTVKKRQINAILLNFLA